jgi:hypothetical protein
MAAGLFASIPIVFLLFYATLGNWMAGRSWGSRYLVVILPYVVVGWAVLLSQMSRGARVFAMVIVTTLGVMVQLPGVFVDYAKVSQAAGRSFTPMERQWHLQTTPLVMNSRALAAALPDNIDYVTGVRSVPKISVPAGAEDRGFSQQFAFSLDFWWLYLFYLGLLPRAGVAAVLGAFAVWIVICARGVGRELA